MVEAEERQREINRIRKMQNKTNINQHKEQILKTHVEARMGAKSFIKTAFQRKFQEMIMEKTMRNIEATNIYQHKK